MSPRKEKCCSVETSTSRPVIESMAIPHSFLTDEKSSSYSPPVILLPNRQTACRNILPTSINRRQLYCTDRSCMDAHVFNLTDDDGTTRYGDIEEDGPDNYVESSYNDNDDNNQAWTNEVVEDEIIDGTVCGICGAFLPNECIPSTPYPLVDSCCATDEPEDFVQCPNNLKVSGCSPEPTCCAKEDFRQQSLPDVTENILRIIQELKHASIGEVRRQSNTLAPTDTATQYDTADKPTAPVTPVKSPEAAVQANIKLDSPAVCDNMDCPAQENQEQEFICCVDTATDPIPEAPPVLVPCPRCKDANRATTADVGIDANQSVKPGASRQTCTLDKCCSISPGLSEILKKPTDDFKVTETPRTSVNHKLDTPYYPHMIDPKKIQKRLSKNQAASCSCKDKKFQTHCTCHFPPAYSQYGCTGHIAGNCKCSK